jgi:hypothetical protein
LYGFQQFLSGVSTEGLSLEKAILKNVPRFKAANL